MSLSQPLQRCFSFTRTRYSISETTQVLLKERESINLVRNMIQKTIFFAKNKLNYSSGGISGTNHVSDFL